MGAREYIAEQCHWDPALKRHLLCSRWFFAKVRREVVPNTYGGYWEFAEGPERTMTWKAKYYAEARGIYDDHTGERYALHDCPFCGGETEAPRRDEPRILPRGNGE